MNICPEEFPEDRIHDPKRQAELMVFCELQASETPGVAFYEARAGIDGREVDYAIWLEDIARTGLQVKGGRYRVDRGIWYLITPGGEGRKPSPAKQSWRSSIQLHDYLQERLPAGRNPFVIPMLVFPDMLPDANIEAWSIHAGVSVLFGTENLVERLIGAVATWRVNYPPSGDVTAEEVELLMPGTMRVAAGIPEALYLHTDKVVFQNVQTVNIYITSDKA